MIAKLQSQVVPAMADVRVERDAEISALLAKHRLPLVSQIHLRFELVAAEEIFDFLDHLLVHVRLEYWLDPCSHELVRFVQLQPRPSFVDETEYLLLHLQVNLRVAAWHAVRSEPKLLLVFRLRQARPDKRIVRSIEVEVAYRIKFMLLVIIIKLHIIKQVVIESKVRIMVQQVFVLVPVEYLNGHPCFIPFRGSLWSHLSCLYLSPLTFNES